MILDFKPRRSALYLPATNEKALAKAKNLPVDIVILDLEDAVAPAMKSSARAAAVAAIREGGFGDREIILRVNGLDSEWARDDFVAAARCGADGILVPKVNGPGDIDRCERLLADAPAALALWAMVETCAAIPALPAIAATASRGRLAGFVMGTNDLAKEMRAKLTEDRLAFLPILTAAVLAARACGLVLLDGVCNDFQDLDRFERECTQGLTLGFDGKTIIHPRQVELCNKVFSPTDAEGDWARQVVEAFAAPQNAGKGVLQIEGRMVELLHLEDARRIVALAAAIARTDTEMKDGRTGSSRL